MTAPVVLRDRSDTRNATASATTGRLLLLPVGQVDHDANGVPPSLHGHCDGAKEFPDVRRGSAEEFYAGGRLFSPMENGFAIAGDYLSAASFLGVAGLIALFGYDGLLYGVGFLVAAFSIAMKASSSASGGWSRTEM